MNSTTIVPALAWNWNPSILIGLALFSLAYAMAAGPWRARYQWGPPAPRSRQAAFHLGTLIAFLALCSPLDGLGDAYLFSAHMAQHMLLIFVTPPLWLAGTPPWLVERVFSGRWARAARGFLLSPLAAFVIFNGVLWAWHLPAAYDFALQHETVHILEHLSFMAAALIGWGPALLDPPVVRLAGPARAFYLFLMTFPCNALAALLTLSPHVLYPFYASAPRAWGLASLADQQTGGLIMWLPGNIILIGCLLWIFGRWLVRQEQAA